MFDLAIVNKHVVTVTLVWHDSRYQQINVYLYQCAIYKVHTASNHVPFDELMIKYNFPTFKEMGASSLSLFVCVVVFKFKNTNVYGWKLLYWSTSSKIASSYFSYKMQPLCFPLSSFL